MKDTVNQIVAEFAKDKDIAALYSEWNKINREKLSLYHGKKKPDIPLEDNREFRSLKNMVIKAAVEIVQSEGQQTVSPPSATSSLQSLATAIAKMISQSYSKWLAKLRSQVDGKLKSKIEQKKEAHGLKTDHTVEEWTGEEDQQHGMHM